MHLHFGIFTQSAKLIKVFINELPKYVFEKTKYVHKVIIKIILARRRRTKLSFLRTKISNGKYLLNNPTKKLKQVIIIRTKWANKNGSQWYPAGSWK